MAPLPPQASDYELDRQITHQTFNSKDGPNSAGNSSSNNTSEQDSTGMPFDTDQEDNEPDPKFLIQSTKDKAKANRENAKALKYSKKILSLSTSSELPHHASSLSRSIVDFVKGMMGCAGTKFRLPLPPSKEEIQQWQSWLDSRQKAIHSAINTQSMHYNIQNDTKKNIMIRNNSRELKQSFVPVKYKPASTLNSKIPGPFQIACNNQFKSQGFSCITFEWNKPNLTDSKWNTQGR
ncbi:hypothetical protein VP01_544g9 [Puccinia sorghi]|uniref:Uncharacterized protein n=1 Tax=Puccinia sorghi TaxID=27349 RepID=A0A0L6UJL1_9BASI|nr:hypothetical protein VP01_544g9 [Puccinia sorghi]